MRFTLGSPRRPLVRTLKLPSRFPWTWVEAALIIALAVQCARLVWAGFAPLGPVGNYTVGGTATAVDPAVLQRTDPFFRAGAATTSAVVTSLPVKLFGVRLDQATGRGSAIIATPDGVQSSFAVGDEIMPGITLKAVAIDNVTIDRGGVAEQLFLDQSKAAPVAQPGATAPSAGGAVSPSALRDGISFAPRLENGSVTGLVVSPKGSGDVFRVVGLQPGDVLTRVNGGGFSSAEDAARQIAALPANAMVTFTVERAGASVTLAAKVGQ
jgi:general secretion pathway protein C